MPATRSHPMWVRGLKRYSFVFGSFQFRVAPHVGAWIETFCQFSAIVKDLVAPHVGAWIETSSTVLPVAHLPVAPHVGAWIETLPSRTVKEPVMSHPMWVRGLKLSFDGQI